MKTFEFFLPYYVWSWSFLTSIKRMFFTMFDYNIDLTKFKLWSYLGWIIFRLIFLYKMFCIWCNQINNAGITFYWIDYYRTFLSKIFTSLSGVINILLLGLFNRFDNCFSGETGNYCAMFSPKMQYLLYCTVYIEILVMPFIW